MRINNLILENTEGFGGEKPPSGLCNSVFNKKTIILLNKSPFFFFFYKTMPPETLNYAHEIKVLFLYAI